MLNPGNASRQPQLIFSDRTIEEFDRLVLVEHPTVSNKELADRQIEQLHILEHGLEIVPVESSPNPLVTLERIKEAQGGNPEKSVVGMATGDGSSEAGVRATLGNGALFWKIRGGNGDNIGRASFPRRDRGDSETILRKGKIAITSPGECLVADANGNIKYHFFFLDEVGFGDSAAASEALNAQEQREKREGFGQFKTLLSNGRASSEAISLARPFSIKRGGVDPEAGDDTRPIEIRRELLYANLGHIANGWIRDIHMTDKKMVEVGNKRVSKLGAKLFFARLYMNALSGTDIPDGEVIDFDIVEPTIMQKSGDHFNVAAGDHVTISRSSEEMLVYSTRPRP